MIMALRDEILEQPAVIRSLLENHADQIKSISDRIGQPPGIVIAARGTSDNAARYAKYVMGANNRIPVALAAPSLSSVYRTTPLFGNNLVIGISQSGGSPDLLAVISAAKTQNCPTLVITNQIQSPLADAADFVLIVPRTAIINGIRDIQKQLGRVICLDDLDAAAIGAE